MRTEAQLEDWKKLYETAGRVIKTAPWKDLWDLDLTAIADEESDLAYFSVHGHEGADRGIGIFEGREGLNDFFMTVEQQNLGISAKYAMFSQTCMTMFVGKLDEAPEAQRMIMKKLGVTGDFEPDGIPFFISYKTGMYPWGPDQAEVIRIREYLDLFLTALQKMQMARMTTNLDFSKEKLFRLTIKKDGKTSWGMADLPINGYQAKVLEIDDAEMLAELNAKERTKHVIDAAIDYLGTTIDVSDYDTPISPRVCMVCDAVTGKVESAHIPEIEIPSEIALADTVIHYIQNKGIPAEVRVNNDITFNALTGICEALRINITKKPALKAINDAMASLVNSVNQ